MDRVSVIDSHTGGEPTRVVVAGGPDLGRGPLAARRDRFISEFDSFRAAVVTEPRGSDVLVGALLVEPHAPGCAAGVIFFNNVGTIGMCGHGMIGLAVTLGRLGRLKAGRVSIDTPVGVVGVEFDGRNRVAVENVPSFRLSANVRVGDVTGDIAWGGNWFFLTDAGGIPLDLDHVEQLTAYTWKIRRGLAAAGITGANGMKIDHIELVGPPADPWNHARNFVLCPGGAFDRSPCGTGTSAKLACLAADGRLRPDEVWRQESVVGSVFEGTYRPHADGIVPTIVGEAFVTAETTLVFDPADPFRAGLRPGGRR